MAGARVPLTYRTLSLKATYTQDSPFTCFVLLLQKHHNAINYVLKPPFFQDLVPKQKTMATTDKKSAFLIETYTYACIDAVF
jgi:hypothetical protein